MANDKVPLLHSLRFRLIASVVTIEVIMLSILVWNNITIIHTTHTDRLRDTANSMHQQIASTSGRHMIAVDYATLKDYLRNILLYKELSYIVIADRDDNDVIALGRQKSNTHPKIDSHPADVHDGMFDITENIEVADEFMGRVLMGFSLSLMEDAIQKSRNRGITIAAIEIVLTIIVTIFIGLGLTRRLSVLAIAAGKVEAGNYSVSVPTKPDDEVGRTAAAFNSMVATVFKRTRQLIAEEKRTQQLLSENRLLIQKSLEVQEEERKNLARELHDELGQCITAIQADAESIRDLSPENNKRLITSADAILNVSSHIYDVVHSMIELLRPNVLDNLGLVEALKEEIHTWDKRNTHLSCHYTFEGDLSDLGERTNITLYRITQECLTNIVKHAYAKNVTIKLINEENTLKMIVNDDGIGMDTNKPSHRLGLGLIGMRERVQSLDGTFNYETSPDFGFRILIHIPLKKDRQP